MLNDVAPGCIERRISANGLSFELLECGQGERLVLCLHGFPSHAICWRHQFPALIGLGYRVWAPNQRGYANTGKPRRAVDYTMDLLLEDVAAIIDVSGASSVVLMGHDWGGLVAWFFATRKVRPLEALIIMNVPHPACAALAFRTWRQLRKSWYIGAFQIPWIPDWLLRFNNAWLTARLMTGITARAETFPPDVLAIYRRSAAAPGAMTAMLNWYRALLRGGVPPEITAGFPVIETRTLVIWGEDDVALDVSGLNGIEAYVANLTLRRLPGVSHWVQEEAPTVVNTLITAFLAGRPVPASVS